MVCCTYSDYNYSPSVMMTLSLYHRLNMNHSESNLIERNSLPRRKSREKETQTHDIGRQMITLGPFDFAEPVEHFQS